MTTLSATYHEQMPVSAEVRTFALQCRKSLAILFIIYLPTYVAAWVPVRSTPAEAVLAAGSPAGGSLVADSPAGVGTAKRFL